MSKMSMNTTHRTSSKDTAIEVKNLSKDFILPHKDRKTLKSFFLNPFSRMTNEKQHALDNVSFEVKKGDFFGIVGRNGSGKSTLLKCIAGIYHPTKGHIKVNGSLVPFIELGVGFNPELSGRDNVYLNASLLGFERSEIDNMYDEIVEFSELERFMDQKLKNYSSGMQVRLAFSIAIKAKGDILLLDEVLAVGDEAFQKKCYQYFAEIRRQKQTVILVTHSMEVVQQFCDRAILINEGRKTEEGKPLKITQIYHQLNNQDSNTINEAEDNKETSSQYITAQVRCTNSKGKLSFDINLKSKVVIDDPIVAMGIYRDTGKQVYRWTSDEKVPFKLDLNTHKRVRIEMVDVFPVGTFTVSLFIKKRDRTKEYATFNDIAKFEIKNLTSHEYATFWKIPEQSFINGKEVKNVH